MPTEQDIRETCERLTKRCSGLILPLYARLSGSRQRLVFEKIDQQKIIVATNIAETSLTIPGIKYVIDSGLARILEYNPVVRQRACPSSKFHAAALNSARAVADAYRMASVSVIFRG